MLVLNDGRKKLYQWDAGRTATVSVDCDVVHFSNLNFGGSVSIEVAEGQVKIPNQLLTSGADVYCWAVVKDENGYFTKKEQIIEVIRRPKPSDYIYNETEVIGVQAAVKNALEEAKESGDFKGDPGEPGANGQPGADGTTPHIGENGNWFIGDTDTGVPATGEGGGSGSGIIAETDPTVFVWAKAHLPFTADQLSAMASGAGFVVNPTNFADGKTYFRYHAGATSFTWTNPNPQRGAVTITVLAWSQYGDKSVGDSFSRLIVVYGDGTTGTIWLENGQTVTMTTDAKKVLTEIRGNYDHENWVLLDMSVLTIAADYPAPTGTVKSVNDNLPDENGNVQIPILGGASVMVGATSDTDGASGLVPAPMAGDEGKFLSGDGTWKMPESSGGGTDLSLGVSGAAVGQTVRITAVDEGGKPTAWEAVDVTAGDTDGSWVKLLDLTTEEDTNTITHTFKDSPMKKIIVTIDTLAASKNTNYCPVTVMTGANAETAFYIVKYYPYPIPTTVAARSTYIVEFVDDGENVNTMITTSYQPIRGGNIEHVGQGNPVMAKMLWKAVDGYNAEPNPNITGFMVTTYATFAAGTIIKIWGIPA